jgi:hypothetical protein
VKTNGPGKYDPQATVARESCKAAGVMLIVFRGFDGDGFSAQLPPHLLIAVPAILRHMADDIDAQLKGES